MSYQEATKFNLIPHAVCSFYIGNNFYAYPAQQIDTSVLMGKQITMVYHL